MSGGGAHDVKVAARGRWLELLVDVGGINPEYLDGKHRPCPKCGGEDRFRLIDPVEGAVLCNQCFREKNGDGLAAIAWMRGCSFRQALELVAARVGVTLRSVGRPRKDAEPLDFDPWNEALVRLWTTKKSGVTVEAVEANGGRLGRWRGPERQEYRVLAIPIVGPLGEKTRGWAFYDQSGANLPAPGGGTCKTRVTKGAKSGWLGSAGVQAMRGAKVVWKVEGVSDMLALFSAIPLAARDSHVVIANPFGALEKPRPENVAPLAGKIVVIVPDSDDVGRSGARRWSEAVAPVAAETRILELPGAGKDLRDWLVAGGTFDQLRELARQLEPVAKPETVEDDELDYSDTDPARIARLFTRTRAHHFATYRSVAHEWTGTHWRALSEDSFRALITNYTTEELRRIWNQTKDEAIERDEEPPKVKKISMQLLAGVQRCIMAYARVADDVPWGSVIEFGADFEEVHRFEREPFVSLRNGVFRIEAYLRGEPDSELLSEHSPEFWTPNTLPFEFDPTAGAAQRSSWMSAISRACGGDEGLVELLQEFTGYLLTSRTDHQSLLYLDGEGATGKSTYIAGVIALLGEHNVSHVPLESFGERFALHTTLGKLANIASEIGELDKVAEGVLKAFVGGDRMTFDRKGRSQVEAEPTARLILAANNLPRIADRTSAMWRRILPVPFHVPIESGDRVAGMNEPRHWLESGEMPAIFNWALGGLARLEARGAFELPPASRRLLADWQAESNPARQFLLEHYEPFEGSVIPTNDLYRRYREWCLDSGHRPLASNTFGKEVRRVIGAVKERRRGLGSGRFSVYSGISARTEGISDDP